jgi:Zn-dependent protease with chaperone function
VHVAVYLPLALPLLAAVSARWVAARLEPRTATWVLTGSALVLAAASGAALAILAGTVLGQVPPLAVIGHWSAAGVRRHDHTSLALAVVACLLRTAALAAAFRAAARRVRALTAAASAARCLPRRRQLTVLDDPAPDAYAMPGLPGKIVVTAGMLEALDDRERQVLLAHERAHLAGAHFAFTALAQLAAAANPLLRPLAGAVGFSVERWADERAARITGDRRLVARTIAKAALLAQGHAGGTPAAALGMAAGSLRGAGPIPRRVAALLAAPPRPHPLLLVAMLTVLLLATGSALEAARDLHGLIQLAGGP